VEATRQAQLKKLKSAYETQVRQINGKSEVKKRTVLENSNEELCSGCGEEFDDGGEKIHCEWCGENFCEECIARAADDCPDRQADFDHPELWAKKDAPRLRRRHPLCRDHPF
jgi:hypothetical protein